MDPEDRGITEQWYTKSFEETVTLPGSMAENGKGEDIKVDTELPSVESVSDRWVSEDSDSFYYEIKKID